MRLARAHSAIRERASNLLSRETRVYDERERELRIRDRDPMAIIHRIHRGYLVASTGEGESVDRRSPDHLRSRSLG